MAHILSDRVKETTTTTGTGAIALGGAVANFRDFDTLMANGDTTIYCIVHRTANEWEVGRGAWQTGNTLTRVASPIASSNAGSLVNLSAGTKDVYMTLTPNGEWPFLRLADGGIISFDANGSPITLTKSGADIILAGGNLVPTAVSTTQPGLRLQAGTLMTTPADGAIESDATNFYGTTDAGNRGYIPIRHFIRANATRTYTSNTSSQAIFNGTPNGRLTLETGTYWFDGFLSFGTMSGTIGNRSIAMLGAGTAVTSNWAWIAVGADVAFGAAAAGGVTHMVTATSPASVVTATTGTSLGVRIAGSFEVNTAGTIIPSTTMVTAAASTLSMGSFLGFERIGTDGVVSVGQWD